MRLLALLFTLITTPALAHFGVVLPSTPMLDKDDGRELNLTLAFTHPFENIGMTLDAPVAFDLHLDGETTSLLDQLEPTLVNGGAGFETQIQISRPGVHLFAMTPQPYWEPDEDAFIIHYTKTYVAAFGDDSGWNAEIGMPTEIVPLSRPFGLWTGNVFQGIVKLDGKPVPYAEVEVEYYNEGEAKTIPSDLMITQTVMADGNGVFTYAPPAGGWWGFAALNSADYQLSHEGSGRDVELGAVLWVHFESWMAE